MNTHSFGSFIRDSYIKNLIVSEKHEAWPPHYILQYPSEQLQSHNPCFLIRNFAVFTDTTNFKILEQFKGMEKD